MTANLPLIGTAQSELAAPRRSIPQTLASTEALATRSESLLARHLLLRNEQGKSFWLPRYYFLGPQGGEAPLRLGIFGGIHGDEPETVQALLQFIAALEQQPEIARGYCLFFYPICNPAGFEARTRLSPSGHDLNREFWSGSRQPEVVALENELSDHSFDGVIALHADDTSEGTYGYARGAVLAKHLLEPALAATEEFLPRNNNVRIEGFEAREGIVRDCFPGVLSPPPKSRPRPFEIIFETPQLAPQFLQQAAMMTALRVILERYREFIAFGRNL